MIVDIENTAERTLISFRASDLTSLQDIRQIVGSIAAGGYCFEAGTLFSEDFENFINNIKPHNRYGIMLGLDNQGKPFVNWGRVKNRGEK